MKQIIHQPFDKLVKSTLQKEKKALEFFKTYLPEEVQGDIDLNAGLKLINKEYIKRNMETLYCDLVYTAKIRGDEGYLYCHVEAQSTPDLLMAFRINNYKTEIMKDHYLETGIMPPVVSIVLYNGLKTPYPHDFDFFKILSRFPEAEKYYISGCYLIDVSDVEEKEMLTRHEIGMMEWLLKNSRRKDFIINLERILHNSKFGEIIEKSDSEYQEHLFLFIIDRIQKITKTEEELMETISRIMPFYDLKNMPAIKLLNKIEFNSGKEEGREEGREEGGRDREISIAKNMLDGGATKDFISKVTGLSMSEIEKL